ncbi:MAG TPA: glycosyltransferase family 4 protein [Chloroflexota bacterium]|jgi:glycosyltransferase involved in cell wall biosynthesis
MRSNGQVKPRFAMVSSTYYVADPRIRRQAEALLAHGYAVDVICQRQAGESPVEDVAGVRVYRVGGIRYRGQSLVQYARVYGSFFIAALVLLTRLQQRHGYAAVQVYSMPEALVFTALWPKLRGVPLIYDAGDLTTELYAAKFGDRHTPVMAGALRLQEAVCLRLADLVVTVHEDYRGRVIARGVPPEHVTVAMNLPDERLFHPGLRDAPGALPPGFERGGQDHEPFIIVNHGSWVERYGTDLAVEAVHLLRDRVPELRLLVYGDGDLRPRLTELVDRLDLHDRVYLAPHYMPVESMPPRLAAADAGIVPSRRDVFTDTMLPNKLLEYLALGLPTVVTRTRTVAAHVPEDVVEYCEPGDAADLARAIERVWADRERRQALGRAALAFSATHRWSDNAARYCRAVDALVARHGRVPAAPAPRPLAASARRSR